MLFAHPVVKLVSLLLIKLSVLVSVVLVGWNSESNLVEIILISQFSIWSENSSSIGLKEVAQFVLVDVHHLVLLAVLVEVLLGTFLFLLAS